MFSDWTNEGIERRYEKLWQQRKIHVYSSLEVHLVDTLFGNRKVRVTAGSAHYSVFFGKYSYGLAEMVAREIVALHKRRQLEEFEHNARVDRI